MIRTVMIGHNREKLGPPNHTGHQHGNTWLRGIYWRLANMNMLVTCTSPTREAVGRPLYSLYSHIDHLGSVGVSIVIYEDGVPDCGDMGRPLATASHVDMLQS